MSDPALEVRGVSHAFHAGGANELRALVDVDLTLEPGAFAVVVGTNGSGKSTLLNAIAGTFVPTSGSIRIAGVDVTCEPEHVRARAIGRVFQDPLTGTAPQLTVAENLALANQRTARVRGLRPALGRSTRQALAKRVASLGMGLEDRLNSPMATLSGGQRQALTLLMATLVRPTLLLLDEHTAALDPTSAAQVLRLTQEVITREGLTTLMVTHSMQEAVRLGDRAIMMHKGRVVETLSGPRKRRVDDLLAYFDQVRNADMLDDSAAEMLRHEYV